MNIAYHSITALPFIATGNYWAALGCVVPDLTWISNEIRFRNSYISDWKVWARYYLRDHHCTWYRVAHSSLIVVPICLILHWHQFLLGWCIHVALDLPTHYGRMQQMPFYPFLWRWKWVFKKFK